MVSFGVFGYTLSFRDFRCEIGDHEKVGTSIWFRVANDSNFGNLPSPGELMDYGMADFGMDYYTWDQSHYRETDSYNASGTYTDVNGVSYSTKQVSSATSWRDTTRDYTDNGSDNGNGSADYTVRA